MKTFDPDAGLSELLELRLLFRKHGLEPWLHYGALLGAVRSGDFIPHDKDIDIGLTNPDPERWRAAVDEIVTSGFKIVSQTNRQDLVRFRKTQVLFDVCVFVRRKGFLRGYLTCSTHVIRYKYLRFLETRELRGSKFSVPNNAEKLLRELYGDDWKVPRIGVPGVSKSWFRDTVLIRPRWVSESAERVVDFLYRYTFGRWK